VESRVRPDAGFGAFALRAPLRLQGDVLNQLRHVGGAATRLLTIQDRDPCSPSFGSFHYAYWRDKTSDFADGETVRITDVLRDHDNALSPEMIFPELSVCGVPASLPPMMFAKASMLRVTKTIHTRETEPQLEVELDHG
jgi:hypothetical protein